jgi:hypothetical protein
MQVSAQLERATYQLKHCHTWQKEWCKAYDAACLLCSSMLCCYRWPSQNMPVTAGH